MAQLAGEGRSRYVDIGESFDAPDDHFVQTLKGAVVLARKFVVDLANIDILAAIAFCLPTKTPPRPGHVLNANTPYSITASSAPSMA